MESNHLHSLELRDHVEALTVKLTAHFAPYSHEPFSALTKIIIVEKK